MLGFVRVVGFVSRFPTTPASRSDLYTGPRLWQEKGFRLARSGTAYHLQRAPLNSTSTVDRMYAPRGTPGDPPEPETDRQGQHTSAPLTVSTKQVDLGLSLTYSFSQGIALRPGLSARGSLFFLYSCIC